MNRISISTSTVHKKWTALWAVCLEQQVHCKATDTCFDQSEIKPNERLQMAIVKGLSYYNINTQRELETVVACAQRMLLCGQSVRLNSINSLLRRKSFYWSSACGFLPPKANSLTHHLNGRIAGCVINIRMINTNVIGKWRPQSNFIRGGTSTGGICGLFVCLAPQLIDWLLAKIISLHPMMMFC